MGICGSIKQIKAEVAGNIEEAYFDEVMFGQQVLQEVDKNDMTQPLHKWIGALQFQDAGDVLGIGTGCLISPNIVLTAAHNIYNLRMKAYNKNFLFYLAACGELKNPYVVEAFSVPEQFKKRKEKAPVSFDYGLLKIKGSVNDDKNFLELNQNINDLPQNMEISIFGYPNRSYVLKMMDFKGRVVMARQNGLKMRGKVIEVRKQKAELVHMISTDRGQSGAPIIAIDKRGAVRIIGVHKGGIQIEQVSENGKEKNVEIANIGKLLNRESLTKMGNWIRAKKGDMFKTTNTIYEPFVEVENDEEIEGSRFHQLHSYENERGMQTELGVVVEKTPLNQEEVEKNEKKSVSRTNKVYKSSLTSMICGVKAKYFKNALDNDQAKLHYIKAVYFGSKDPEIHINLGQIYQKQQKLIDAARCYRQAISCDPEYFGGYHYLEKICVVFKDQEIMEASEQFLLDKLKLGVGVKRIKHSLQVIQDNKKKVNFYG